VQATYSIGSLARAASLSPKILLRLLRAAKIELLLSGRVHYVPLSEIESKVPVLWKSILAAERLRTAAR
jgi:hypothetical protein